MGIFRQGFFCDRTGFYFNCCRLLFGFHIFLGKQKSSD